MKWTLLRWSLILLIAAVAIQQGLTLRTWSYSTVGPAYPGDINNAWDQGSAVCNDAILAQSDGRPLRWRSFFIAYLKRYDAVMSMSSDGRYSLDYPPGRLLIMSLWVKQEKPRFVPFFSNPTDAKFADALLRLDTIAELSAAVLAFFIVRLVLQRSQAPWTNELALLAALLLWFNPVIFLDRAWPQWDAWLLPFYLSAAFLALQRQWFFAGVCIGVGMMFKGQILCAAAIFFLWPLFQGKWRQALDVAIGGFLAAMICASPWLIRTPMAGISSFILLCVAGVGVRFIPKNWQFRSASLCTALAIFISGLFFRGTFAWWLVPFAYSSHHFHLLSVGTPNNLAALLQERWGWRWEDILLITSKPHIEITMRQLLVLIYGILLVACTFGLARADLRNDRRILLGLATPWILMFAFMPQMHERYLYWGAVLSALSVGVSLGATLLHLVTTLLASLAMAGWLSRISDVFSRKLLIPTHPDSAWAVILIALIFLYLSITPSAGKPKPPAIPMFDSETAD